MRILVAEDDRALRDVLQRGLREAGYVVDVAEDGEQAVANLTAVDYEVAILDWRMPKLSGIEVIEATRKADVLTPILMLTARDTPSDRVEGLNAGADDYLVKPFEFAELVARLRALQRRPALRHTAHIVCGDLLYDPSARRLEGAGKLIELTTTESLLMELLLRRNPEIVSRRTIANQVWPNATEAVGSNTIEVHIARLRSKIQHCTARIETVRGFGYRLVPS
ncbi:MAG TPA: response regulator transcription factor [Acidimicrobiales bacterium]|jgi:DNA-binding response OmpR family regulator